MVVVTAHGTVKPDCAADFVKEMRPLLPLVRREEGCFKYDLLQSAFAPNDFLLIEEWSSRAAWERHVDAPHMQGLFQKTASWFSTPIEITVYEVAASSTKGSMEDLV